MKKLPAQNKCGFAPIIIILCVVAVVVISYSGYILLSTKSKTSQTQQKLSGDKQISSSPKLRSKAPGVVTQAVTSKGINSTTGEAVDPATIFSKTDKLIYLVLTLQNPKVGTKFEFTRFLNGKFLDNGSLEVKKTTTNNVSFSWTLKKPGATHLAGEYKVKVYTNGVFEKEINYKVQ